MNDRSRIESLARPAIVKTRYIGAPGAIWRTISRTSGAIVSARGVLRTYAGDEIAQLLGLGTNQREIDVAIGLLPQVVLLHIVHDADHRLPGAQTLSLQSLADGRFAGP